MKQEVWAWLRDSFHIRRTQPSQASVQEAFFFFSEVIFILANFCKQISRDCYSIKAFRLKLEKKLWKMEVNFIRATNVPPSLRKSLRTSQSKCLVLGSISFFVSQGSNS